MSILRRTVAGVAVAATAAGLTIVGSGAASAAVVTPAVQGTTVQVNITEPLPGQTCLGMLVPPYVAIHLIAPAASGDLMEVVRALGARDDVIAMRTPGPIRLPVTLPGLPGTLSAENVPPNIYAVTVFCMRSDGPVEPHLFPAVVGPGLDPIIGSVEGSTGS